MPARPWPPTYGVLVSASLALAVLGFAAGSSSVPLFFQQGGKQARWIGLALLLVVGVAWSVSVGRRRVLLTRRFAPVAALGGLAVLSATWSVAPRVGGERAISFLLLLAAAAALARASAGSVVGRRAVAVGLVVGCAVVIVGGLIVLAFAPDYAVQWATTQNPLRYRGFGVNPNTVPLLLALCLPLALWAAVDASGRVSRVFAWVVVVGFVAQIVASGSRGAALASVVTMGGSVVLLDRSTRYRLAAASGVIVLLGYGFVLRELVTPVPPPSTVEALEVPVVERRPPPPDEGTPPQKSGTPPATSGNGVRQIRLFYVNRRDEIGHPLLGSLSETSLLFGGSGRLSVWPEVLRTASQRPLLGYGFGTEANTFTDRWYVFDGGLPENSYLGWILQLGIVGAALFFALGAMLVVVARRALRTIPDGPERRLVAAFSLTVLAGLLLAAFQSYLYSVGNIAALPFWVAAFVLLASGLPARRPDY